MNNVSPVADPGFLEGGFCCAQSVRKILEATPLFSEPRPFRSFWAKLPAQSICFRQLESSLRLTHAKVSHSSSFLRSVARAGGSISWKSKPLHNVLVFQVCQRGFPRKLWKPVWIRYWSTQLIVINMMHNNHLISSTSVLMKAVPLHGVIWRHLQLWKYSNRDTVPNNMKYYHGAYGKGSSIECIHVDTGTRNHV